MAKMPYFLFTLIGFIVWCLFDVTAALTTAKPWGTVIEGEYCDYEHFRATCAHGATIIMQTALYGHIEMGKCITTNIGFLGCYEDVLDILDSKCTGRRQCDVDVADPALRQTQPCVSGIALYLKVTYTCVTATRLTCAPIRARENMDFIPSMDIFKENCQGKYSMDIEVEPGQYINLTLFNLHQGHGDTEAVYGRIIGVDNTEIAMLTGSTETSYIGVLPFSRATIILDERYRNSKFLVGFAAVGCQDIDVQSDIIFQRHGNHGNTATVSCRNSQQSWQLTCQGVRWLGVIGNCSQKIVIPEQVRSAVEEATIEETSLALPKDAIFMIIICSTVFMAIIVVATGCLVVHRNKIRQREALIECSDYTTMRGNFTPAKDFEFFHHELPILTATTKTSRDNEDDCTTPVWPATPDFNESDYMPLNNVTRT